MEHKLDKTITLPEGWVCSDPDTHQYRKAISSEVYEFREMLSVPLWESATCTFSEFWELPNLWKIATNIDIAEYSRREIDEMLSCYYADSTKRAAIMKDCPEVVAEVIFELEMYDDV